MARLHHILILVMLSQGILAQGPDSPDLINKEHQLQLLFEKLYSDSIHDKEAVQEVVLENMSVALALDGAMDFPWSKLDRIGKVISDDSRLRIFTWHLADGPDQFSYYGFIQVQQRKGTFRLYPLTDALKGKKTERKLDQTPDAWHGKLYYQIVTKKYRRKTTYTLMGLDFNNSRTTIKTVEAMVVQRDKPQFLKKTFFNGTDRLDRMVFEYSSKVAISVRYDPSLEIIAFDHLVPHHQVYTGDYAFYGPDGSYDGLEFSAGTWIFRKDIDARNQN